jgi:hypothetical protein
MFSPLSLGISTTYDSSVLPRQEEREHISRDLLFCPKWKAAIVPPVPVGVNVKLISEITLPGNPGSPFLAVSAEQTHARLRMDLQSRDRLDARPNVPLAARPKFMPPTR